MKSTEDPGSVDIRTLGRSQRAGQPVPQALAAFDCAFFVPTICLRALIELVLASCVILVLNIYHTFLYIHGWFSHHSPHQEAGKI
jgi:ABC-type anion transport system duplicated permease subunit